MGDFFWEDGGTLPQSSYKPFQVHENLHSKRDLYRFRVYWDKVVREENITNKVNGSKDIFTSKASLMHNIQEKFKCFRGRYNLNNNFKMQYKIGVRRLNKDKTSIIGEAQKKDGWTNELVSYEQIFSGHK